MANPPQPLAHGSLDSTPFPHVLVSIASRGLEGTLAVWAPPGQSGQDRIYFRGGRVTKARLLESSSDLTRGLLPLFRRETTYAFYEADLVGDGQLEGSVDVRALLAAGLRGGISNEAAERIFARYEGQKLRVQKGTDLAAFAFLPKERAFVDMFRSEPLTIDEATAAAGSAKVARRVLYALSITKSLEVFAGEFERKSLTELTESAGQFTSSRPPQASSPPSGSDPRFSDLPGLDSEPPPSDARQPSGSAQRPVSGSAPRPPSGSAPRPSQRAARVSAAPQRSARPGKPSSAPSPRPSARSGRNLPPEPPASLSAELQERWRKLTERAVTIDEETYFDMLGVQQNESMEGVRNAYFAQVKQWHPDRLPPELQPLKPWADEIFQHLTAAHETLSDEEERGAYLKTVQSGGGTPRADRELERVLGAAMEFQKVEVLIRRRDWDHAERLVRDLMEIVPDEADYHAALGLVLWSGRGESALEEAMAELAKALQINPRHERALFTKARILDRQGEKALAIAFYEKVVEVNPKNVDAQRQVRLAKMRGQDTGGHSASTAPAKKEASLFGKLFGGKK